MSSLVRWFFVFALVGAAPAAQSGLVRAEASIPLAPVPFPRVPCAIGDLDGDGRQELALGLPQANDGGTGRGALEILFLDASGGVRSSTRIAQGTGGFGGLLDNGDAFGAALAALGDLDGDGVEDLAVGAPGDDDGGLDYGAVWILFPRADGTLRAQWKISATRGGFGGSLDFSAAFGQGLSAADVDGDGHADLCVGVDADQVEPQPLWILFLNGNGSVRDEFRIVPGTLFSGKAGFLPDLDGDGVPELARVAIDVTPGMGMPSTTLELLRLRADGSVSHTSTLGSMEYYSPTAISAPPGIIASGAFGFGGIQHADLDGDGRPEIVVGDQAIVLGSGSMTVGVAWLLFLDEDERLREIRVLAAGTEGLVAPGMILNGYGVAPLGDLDGDGIGELALPAYEGLTLAFLHCAGRLSSRQGTGVNDSILAASAAPKLGVPFDLELNCLGHAPGNAFLFGFARPGSRLLPAGELLVDPTSRSYFVVSAPHLGAVRSFHFDVPGTTALCGLELSIQGACFGAPGLALSNALDLRLGH